RIDDELPLAPEVVRRHVQRHTGARKHAEARAVHQGHEAGLGATLVGGGCTVVRGGDVEVELIPRLETELIEIQRTAKAQSAFVAAVPRREAKLLLAEPDALTLALRHRGYYRHGIHSKIVAGQNFHVHTHR